MFMRNIIIRKITDNNLKIAKDYILSDRLVAFPTETVYGLGGNALSDAAIKSIYAAKGRPSDNPLIVHVDKDRDISDLVYDDREYARKIREAFLPGPLTMVYRSKDVVSPLCSCGLNTLAIRVPKSEAAQRFLKIVGVPIAAPSANKSKHTSPVTAEHVYGDFGSEVPLILDGGRCEGGIESTVLDVTGEVPVILRKGLVTAEMIKSVVGVCEYARDGSSLSARSPGTKYRHYCPKTETALFSADELDKAVRLYEEYERLGKRACFLAKSEVCERLSGKRYFDLGKTGKEMAARLYYYLHEGEKYDMLIGIRFLPEDEFMLGVENRFLKAFG